MNRPKSAVGKIKNTVIVLLVISAVFFGWKSRLFGNSTAKLSAVFDVLASINSEDENAALAMYTEASKPMCIVVTNAEGDHYGIKYNMSEIGALYDGKTVLAFSEAFSSAQEPEKVTVAEWETALTSSGIYYEYISPIKLSVLDGWYGTSLSGDWSSISVRRLCVATGEDDDRLYFIDEDTGEYYAADTEKNERITEMVESSSINSTRFAFELNDAFQPPECYTLVFLDDAGHPAVNVTNPLVDEELLNNVLLDLGLYEPDQSSYPIEDGTYYVGEGFMIRLLADGTLYYHRTETETDDTVVMDESDAVELAREQIAGTIAETCGVDADVYFDSIQQMQNGGYQIFFSYIISGGVVYLAADGYAAAVTVANGMVTEMELRFRSYSVSGETKLLPEEQAAAASNGAYRLSYLDNGSDTRLEPVWISTGT